jgi:hypothetical protein
VAPGIVFYGVENIVSIIPQALVALVIIVLLSFGALTIGSNAPRHSEVWQPAVICTTGNSPVTCVDDK